MVSLPELKEQTNKLWSNLDGNKKIIWALILTATLLSIIVLVFVNKPRYEVLFANLSAEDAGEITNWLEEMDISHQLTDNGSSILVPKDKVYSIRNNLAIDGIPRGGVVGFGIFNEGRLGTTEFERRVQYRRAIQGELTRTITAMAGIKNAWVQISIPEPRLYLSQEEKSTGAILLETVGELHPDQVRGIVHLVSHSVEGLETEQITVVDTRGQVLSQDLSAASGLSLTSNQFDIQRQTEKELEQGLRTMLEMVIGIGKVVTKVKAEINFDQMEVTTQLFEPTKGGEGIIRSIQELERTFHGEGGTGNVPGTDANIPGSGIPIYQEAKEGESEYYEREITTNYDITEIHEHRVIAPGQVKRLSVAVLIDENELTLDQRMAIEDTVSAAVGLDFSRGDQITVASIPFADSPFVELEDLVGQEKPYRFWLYPMGAGLLLFTGLLLYRYLRRRRQMDDYQAVLEEMAAVQGEEEDGDGTERKLLLEQVGRLIRQQPETVAQLLKTWMAED